MHKCAGLGDFIRVVSEGCGRGILFSKRIELEIGHHIFYFR